MDNSAILRLMTQADKLLDQISVCGPDVYALVSARNALKQAYDLIQKQEKEATDDGG